MIEDRCSRRSAIFFAFALTLALPLAYPKPARAFSESPVGTGSPVEAPPLPPGAMSVVPGEGASPAPTPHPAVRPRIKRRTSSASERTASHEEFEVEAAKARLRIKEDAWIFTRPSNRSAHIKKAEIGKFVVVTGSTRYYLQVRLKDGKTGYIPQSAVDLVVATNKYFKLTRNAPVLEKPNRWGKKVAEVHTPYYVHVIGFALNYVQIKMKSGLVGFVTMDALK